MAPYVHQYNESEIRRVEKFKYYIISTVFKNTSSSNNDNNNNNSNIYFILFEYLIFNIKNKFFNSIMEGLMILLGVHL